MNRPRLLGLALALFASACSATAPDFPVLPVGAKVVIGVDNGRQIGALVVREDSTAREDIELPKGSRAVVVYDQMVERPMDPKMRIIRVRLDDGPKKGLEVKLARYLVRQDQ